MAKKVNSVDTQSGDIAVQWVPGGAEEAYNLIPVTLVTSDNKTIDTSKVTVKVTCDTVDGLSAIYDTTTGWTLSKGVESFNPSSALTITVAFSLIGYQSVEWTGQTVSTNTTNTTLTFIPATLSSEIARLTQAKADIKAAIEAKGVTVGSGTIDTYASKIGEISSGGNTIEGGSSGPFVCNLMFHPLAGGPTETCTNTGIAGDFADGSQNVDLILRCDDNSNVNIKITRSTLDRKTGLRVCDVVVECYESDFFTIDIYRDSFTKDLLYYYTNMSTVSAYEDLEGHRISISVSAITQDIAFSTGCVLEM